ncbi:MAG TPA: ABC transporter ATP-binding protein [Chitinophaga sp.]|uniref:ATP-binding cassette domain-containing protein n=1 Tax=Chitinophaga tropicalis TaxID=2683588 RepID=A0A7K1U8T3_9BACT|nr:ABC transporter ATP-binding protein [Chitinophaga tropicalis]MVT10784.1 ATP-binding cassette domain-containing protein [Chitinophaga tropicalis]HJT74012.1 ABC transporter ATP-binding protein [Chitinophaga sp.]
MLTARNLTKNYSNLHVLKGVSVSVSAGEIVTIVGSSGAGKSTLLHLLGTLDTPTSGEVWLNDVNLTLLKGNALADFRNRHMGFIFQFHHLLPEFSALENVCIPGFIAGVKKSAVKERAAFLLETLGLGNRKDHKPNELSGGEQQRVAVARALINTPDIVMADEPTGNLDSKNARELHQLFIELRDKFRQTFIIVTHNEELAPLSDRQLVMKDGRMVGQEIDDLPLIIGK